MHLVAVEPSAVKPTRWFDLSVGLPTHSVLLAVKPIHSVEDSSAEKPMHCFAPVLMEQMIQEAFQSL